MAIGEADVLAQRTRNQYLDELADRTCEQVARQVAGVQAQVPAAAELALRARSASLSSHDVARALYEERSLVRTWLMRGAVHLVTPDTLAVASAVLTEHARERDLRLLARLGYAEPIMRRLWELVIATLERAREPMTREDLAEQVSAGGNSYADVLRHSWGIALRPLATAGLICFGPPTERKTTFVLIERWLGRQLSAGGDPARQFALAYLTAFGPATVTDFAFWSGLPVRQARTLCAPLDSCFTSVDHDGPIPQAATQLPAEPPAARVVLLPAFDAYLLGHKKKALIVDQARYKEVFGAAGRIAPTILYDGKIVGTWDYQRRPNRVEVRYTAFDGVSLPPAGLRAAAEHMAGYWGLPATVLEHL